MPIIYVVTFVTSWTELGLCFDSSGLCVPVTVTKYYTQTEYLTKSEFVAHVFSQREAGSGYVDNIFFRNTLCDHCDVCS